MLRAQRAPRRSRSLVLPRIAETVISLSLTHVHPVALRRELLEPVREREVDVLQIPAVLFRSNRVAMMSADGTVEDLNAAAGELEDNKFIVVDEETEEVLIRSFVKHDGLMKSPNLAAALAREYGNVYSKRIREVVAFEVQKLHRNEPELKG